MRHMKSWGRCGSPKTEYSIIGEKALKIFHKKTKHLLENDMENVENVIQSKIMKNKAKY